MNTHSFSVELAKQIGLKDAIILQHFYYWHQNNRKQSDRLIDGLVWSYNSIKSICEIFPYLSEKEVKSAIDRLIASGLLVEGNYNKFSFDRTKWYAITDNAKSIFHNVSIDITKSKMEQDEKSNGAIQNVSTIPNVTSNINTNITSNNIDLPVFSKNEQASEIESLNAKIERLEALVEQMEKRNTAEGAERNNVASTELGVLSASIGLSYVNTQESKDNPVKATKTRNKGNILIENDANFQSLSIFEQKWNESMQNKYPNLCPQLVYEWFVPAVQAKYNGTYKDHFAALRTWLGRSSDVELARLCKNKPMEQYNNEGLINDIINRTAGQHTTMQKLDSMFGDDWDNFVKSRK